MGAEPSPDVIDAIEAHLWQLEIVLGRRGAHDVGTWLVENAGAFNGPRNAAQVGKVPKDSPSTLAAAGLSAKPSMRLPATIAKKRAKKNKTFADLSLAVAQQSDEKAIGTLEAAGLLACTPLPAIVASPSVGDRGAGKSKGKGDVSPSAVRPDKSTFGNPLQAAARRTSRSATSPTARGSDDNDRHNEDAASQVSVHFSLHSGDNDVDRRLSRCLSGVPRGDPCQHEEARKLSVFADKSPPESPGLAPQENMPRMSVVTCPASERRASGATAASMEVTENDDTQRFLVSDAQAAHLRTRAFFAKFDPFWVPLLFVYTLYLMIDVPVAIALELDTTAVKVGVDFGLDLVYVIEIVCRFQRPYLRSGVDVYDKADVARHYRNTNFWWDLAATFPFDLVALVVWQLTGMATNRHVIPAWSRLNRLMLARYADEQFSGILEKVFAGSPATGRAIRTMWMFFLACHFTGCLFLVVLGAEGDASLLDFTSVEEMVHGTDFQRYALFFDYSLKALVGMGRPGRIIPPTDVQTTFSIFVALFGVCLYALMLATIGNIESQQVSPAEEWRGRRDAIHDMLNYFGKFHTLPDSFKEDVHSYFYHEFWKSRVLLGKPSDIFGDIPPMIGTQINAVVGGQVFSRIPMFQAAVSDAEFVNFMVSRLEARTYCEGEVVMRKGEEGDFMFFLIEGDVGIFDETAKKVVFVIGRGAALGDIALLQDCRRTATVVAVGHCSCFLLTRSSFLEAEVLFPDVMAGVRQEGEKKLNKTVLFDSVPLLSPFRNDAVVAGLIATTRPEIHPPGTVVVKKGALTGKLYFIAEGSLEADDGTPFIAGDFFGAVSCTLGMREAWDITAVTNVTLYVLLEAHVTELEHGCPTLFTDVQLSAYFFLGNTPIHSRFFYVYHVCTFCIHWVWGVGRACMYIMLMHECHGIAGVHVHHDGHV